MKKILVIDDLRSFHPDVELNGAQVIYARTSQAALVILSGSEDFSEIWFDHDLGENDGKIDSTMPIVNLLSELAFNDNAYPAKIYVHTSNPVGRKNITSSLTRWGYEVIQINAPDYFVV